MKPAIPSDAGRHVVVTGGAGFIGSHLCRLLCEDSGIAQVTVLDRNAPTVRHLKIRHHAVDLGRRLSWQPDMPVDTVFHLAAACREPGFEWDEYFAGNHGATRVLVDWLVREDIRNVVFTSTAMVFRAGDTRHVESDLPNADTAYGISKALAEETLRGWQQGAPGRRLRVVRPGVVFGAGAGGNFVNLQRALARGLFVYVGRRTTVKSAIYVKDLVRLLQFVATDAGNVETLHGAYAEPTTIESVCRAFCAVYGWRRWIPVLPFRLALLAAMPFQFLNAIGLRNPVHTRRIEKLFHSTHLGADALEQIGFRQAYTLEAAIRDWRNACAPDVLH